MKRLWTSRPVRLLREMARMYFDKRLSRAAAGLAYYFILTFFPALICVNGFIGVLDLDVGAVLRALRRFLPADALAMVGDYLGYISTNQSSAMLAAGITMTLASASAAFRALMNTMDDLYGRRSYTGVWQVVASLIFSILLLLTVYLSMVVVLTGSWLFTFVEQVLGLAPGALPWAWQWLRFLLLFALVLLFVLLTYRMAAPRGDPRPPLLTGGVLAAAALVAASALFSWFIGMSSRYSLVYGSLTSIIFLLLWLYLCGNILILGNVFNCVWYRWKKTRYLNKLGQGESPPGR